MEESERFSRETGLEIVEGSEPGSWIVKNQKSYLQVLSLIKEYNNKYSTRICCFQGTSSVVIYIN